LRVALAASNLQKGVLMRSTKQALVPHDAIRLPSLITLLRLPLAIAFLWASREPAWAITILLLAGLTDILDGWAARRLHLETEFGRILDPIMDKAFVLTVVATLVVNGSLGALEALLLATRDIGEIPVVVRAFLFGEASVHARRGPNAAGKAATLLQFTALVWILLQIPHAAILVLVAGACGLVAAISYWMRERQLGRDRVDASLTLGRKDVRC
jgi:CDP-diacylglycerol--glycerol-3-phosphate 3-phosphatidyltransferase